MSRYPDECHLIFAIGFFFIGIGMIFRGINDGDTLPLGIGITIFAILWSACSLESIIKKYR